MGDNNMQYQNDSEQETTKVKKYTKGFYVVFALCICAIGIAGWYTYADVKNYMSDGKIPDTAITSSEPQNKQAEAKISGVKKATERATESISDPPTQAETEPITEAPTQAVTEMLEDKRVSPVGDNKEVVSEFSGDNFVYFDTLKDWRLHRGTDYAVRNGDKVYSIARGTVTSVVKDELYGDGIEIEYADGITAAYYGVEPGENIASGSVIEAGETIGKAKEVPCEKNLKHHIHLEITRDGQYINAESYLNNQE